MFSQNFIDELAEAVAERVSAKLASQAQGDHPAAPDKTWLDTTEAAAYLNCSRQHLEGLRCKGNGPRYHKPHGIRLIRYTRTDLDAWLTARANTAEGES